MSNNLKKRLPFFASCASLVLSACATPNGTTTATPISAEASSSPNIIYILTDDQRYDELGILNKDLQTPHMDALANEGVHFKNAFVTTALCSPSRATILTGMYMNRHGIVDNNRPIKDGTVFFPSYLQSSGYETAFIGKWHMGGEGDDPQPGFDHWVSFAGQGHYRPKDWYGRQNMLNVNGTRVPQAGYITDELTDYAIEWLNTLDGKQPFFLYLSHKAVHSEFLPAERHQEQYNDVPITLPENGLDEPENYLGKPMWVRNQRNSWHGVDYPYHRNLDIAEYKRRYLQTLSAVDDSLGRVQNWLVENDLDDDTIIVFMSDNGFLFGEHGLIDKRNAYEESMRVPLLVSGPGILEGVQRDEVVANLDVAPTILEFAGIGAPEHFQGQSFANLARVTDADDDWRSELVYEYFWEYNFPHTPTTFAIRTDRYKYIQYHGIWDTDELYDLQNDPKEANNLIDHPDHANIVVELRDRLFELRQSEDGRNVIPYNNKTRRIFDRRSKDGSQAADFPKKWIDD